MSETKQSAADVGKTPFPRLKKVVIPFEDDGPAGQPLFVNLCQVAYHDSIVYIDVGVIPVDEFAAATIPEEYTFALQTRLVMGVPTLKNLQEQIANILAQVDKTNDSSTQTLPQG